MLQTGARQNERADVFGLSEREAAKRLRKYGPNEFGEKKRASAAGLFFSQFKDILIIILIVSTLLSLILGDMTESVAIIAIVLMNAVLGFVQEYKTEKTLDALKKMAAPTAKVFRAGVLKVVKASLVVPGDVISLEAGDRAPADAFLEVSSGLEADESLLTGESLPVKKSASGEGSERLVFMGTMITNGNGRAVARATGMSTEMGRIAGILSGIEDEKTPLQKRLSELGKYIAIGCVVVCAAVAVTGILRGEPVMDMIITGVSLAVAAVPEGLPAIVTIALALGVRRMIKRNALIRRLPAVETLGCATVICTDKTGTITENRMTVRRMCTPDGESRFVPGTKNYPHGVMLSLEIGAVCNDAEIQDQRKGMIIGDATEAALLRAAGDAGLSVSRLLRLYRRESEIPFDSSRKMMSVVVSRGEKKYLLVKGAPDIVIKRCTLAYTQAGNVLFSAVRKKMTDATDRMADNSLRVLAFAYRELMEGEAAERAPESGLIFTGIAGMMDPPRRDAVKAVSKCRRAGIKTVMITGDYRKTAAAVAKETGILRNGGGVVTGAELDRMSDAELRNAARDACVFARVTPEHKLRIVRAYRSLGNVVAMTGDGVNDAPAVKEADIGVSMGKTGTDVTKEASSVILMDDNFSSLVSAVEEGRVIYSNIRKFIRYMLSCNIGEVLTMFIGMLMGLPVILTPIQILWVNLVTDGLPAIALGLDPPEDNIMSRPPRNPRESIFANGLAGTMIFRGFIIGLSTLGAFVTAYKTCGITGARTVAFLTLIAVQLIHVFECKSETKSLFSIPVYNNPALIASVAISAVLILAVIYIPALKPVFGTISLGPAMLFCVFFYSMIGPVISALFLTRRRYK